MISTPRVEPAEFSGMVMCSSSTQNQNPTFDQVIHHHMSWCLKPTAVQGRWWINKSDLCGFTVIWRWRRVVWFFDWNFSKHLLFIFILCIYQFYWATVEILNRYVWEWRIWQHSCLLPAGRRRFTPPNCFYASKHHLEKQQLSVYLFHVPIKAPSFRINSIRLDCPTVKVSFHHVKSNIFPFQH